MTSSLIRSVCCLAALAAVARADEIRLKPADVHFFETRIRPVLVTHCYECHSAESAELGGQLRLDSRDAIVKGGESGPAVVSGQPDRSLIVQALRYDGLEMPPDKPLSDAVVNDFVEWVRRGAPDPRSNNAERVSGNSKPEIQKLWSLRPFRRPAVPEVKGGQWPSSAIDRFVLARIEAAGARPTSDADPATLVRRLHIDLIGLPPTYEEVGRFVDDYHRDGKLAVSQLVDRLLDSHHFGERWGRHWLDVARYGESNGNDGLGRNPTFPHAWRYRDYVIESFNKDLPYHRFVSEQVAGDLLPADDAQQRDRQLIATGFLALSAKPAKAMNNNFLMDVVADQIDVVGRGIMGLSVACARCHDHKFDPIPTKDYYALAGIFTSTETMWGTAAHEGLTAPATDLHVLKASKYVPPPDGFRETVFVLESNTGKPKPIPPSKWPKGTPLAMGVRDRAKPQDCRINIKGEAGKTGEAVSRGFLTAVEFPSGQRITVNKSQSGRLELAAWLTAPDNPLTARVMVNRIWLHLFGEGLVRTPDDFGVYGARPTHPLLLDYLAADFVEDGWSVKQLIRKIVLSRTYQLDSLADAQVRALDPANLLLTRHRRRRMDAETLRDSMLVASQRLDRQPRNGSLVGHRDILINLAGNLHQPSRHRSVYLCYLRNAPPPELAAFDLPDFTTVTGRRDISTVPGQALHLLNNPFVVEQSQYLAALAREHADSQRDRIVFLYRRVLSRDPDAEELFMAGRLVDQAMYDLLPGQTAWMTLAQALLLTNEFRYVD